MQLYKERVRKHLTRLTGDKGMLTRCYCTKMLLFIFCSLLELKWIHYPPMDRFHRLIVASLADEFGLVSHEFGEEEIDRYIVV